MSLVKTSPNHVVIIPDGNRRWAKNKNKKAVFGHLEGYARIKEIITYTKESDISFLTVWAFSTENWKRKQDEVGDIFDLITQGLAEIHALAKQEKIKMVHIGRRDRMSKKTLNLIETVEEETKNYNSFCLCLAIDYGGEDELTRSAKELQTVNDPTKTLINYLDTTKKNIPNPDLIIRTGGEIRTSGFMPLQSAYSEYVFSSRMFPDFTVEEFKKALQDYSQRERKFGK